MDLLPREERIYTPKAVQRVHQRENEEIADAARRRGAKIGKNVRIMGTIDYVNPHLVSIGENTVLGAQAAVLAHGPTKIGMPTIIGANVYVGFGAIILQGVTVGDNCIIGAGAVVTHDIPANSIAAGNPARVLRQRDPEELARFIDAIEQGEYIGAVIPPDFEPSKNSADKG